MSDVATVREAIRAKLAGVAGIGVVNDFQRYTAQQSDLQAMYVYDPGGGQPKQLRGWFLSRMSYKEVFEDLGRWSVFTTWRVTGFMALADATASEKIFDDLIESACDAFRLDDNLGGAILSSIDPESGESGLRFETIRPVLFAGVLCHQADGRLFTQHLK